MKVVFRYLVYIFAIIGFVLMAGFFAIKLGLTNDWGIVDEQREAFLYEKATNTKEKLPILKKGNEVYVWQTMEEWQVIKKAIIKDKNVIMEASKNSGVNPRIVVAQVFVEQLRLFTTNRELFKTVFAPLNILGVQSQFSWGVVGIKQETAIQIENNLKDSNSFFYLGKQYEHLLDFKTENKDEERFTRIIDEDNRYYSYLYAGLHIKQLEVQWEKAGYNIKNRPEILSTLFNIGFKYSIPNANPKSGGASISVGEKDYSFGSLAGEFYNSNELLDVFPR